MMICPFCAEEIQDAAILCRFCGSMKSADGQWVPPAQTVSPEAQVAADQRRSRGAFTIKSSGVFFIIAGLISLLSVTSDVPLFGAMHGGAVAIVYNLVFVVTFLGMGIGLLKGTLWGYQAVMAGTILYSADRLMFVLDKATRDAYLSASEVPQQLDILIDTKTLDQGIVLTSLISVFCWWGFALYIYFRRDYFQPSKVQDSGAGVL